ncbi:nucleoside-diphosphate sugar epimerase/dehydratase [Corynebacterium atrinae]|uniref:nucleoside-diphosphate sugar epimerase/dehydratase n=1 Tax=Corynebacterium atrinae TaxID=1336740 RepID=UPI0025B417B1|nr:nucleoside-diphosphate sugar epimerase/dehydratase [Corynebacterium atrinae]
MSVFGKGAALTPSRPLILLWDVLSWVGAIFLLALLRYDFEISSERLRAIGLYGAVSIVAYLAFGAQTKVLRSRYRVASFEEALALGLLTFAASTVGWSVAALVFGPLKAPPVMVLAVPPIVVVLIVAGRGFSRALRAFARESDDGKEPVIIIGAGDAGNELARAMAINDQSPYRVVGFLDDDPTKRHLRLMGRPVLGQIVDLENVAARYEVDTAILAISVPGKELVSRLSRYAKSAEVELLTLPPVAIRNSGKRDLVDKIRRLEVSDFLGRAPIDTDLESVKGYVQGKRVLITGAGGSIGSEIARQVHSLGPSQLYLLDRDESALCAVQLDIYGNGLLDTDDMVLCDIRDIEAVNQVFEKSDPDVVFHAAALKHLPMLQRFPEEGWKTNVLGTRNVLDAALRQRVETFVNISTDKAAEPTSVLGRTKQIAEHLTAAAAQKSEDGRYVSVRFGNVLGSRGSVLHSFSSQIERGGPITVTDPSVERYFMTIPEACALVIQAGSFGAPGEVLVLDMGEPVKIVDVAQRMVEMSGEDIEIVFTGLRPGEKMSEILLNSDELSRRPFHPLVSHVSVPPCEPGRVGELFDGVIWISDLGKVA